LPRRIVDALTTSGGLPKALVVDEGCVDLIMRSALNVVSIVSNVKVWMFLNANSEVCVQKAQFYGLIKGHSKVKVLDNDANKTLVRVAASMLCIGGNDVIIVHRRILSHIGNLGLTNLLLTCVANADYVIFHEVSEGQKAGIVENIMHKMSKTVFWTPLSLNYVPQRQNRPDILVIDGPGVANQVSANVSKEDGNGTDQSSAK
jgi:hypothetical protein